MGGQPGRLRDRRRQPVHACLAGGRIRVGIHRDRHRTGQRGIGLHRVAGPRERHGVRVVRGRQRRDRHDAERDVVVHDGFVGSHHLHPVGHGHRGRHRAPGGHGPRVRRRPATPGSATPPPTAGGAYSLDLPAGTYKLYVQPNEPGYADQWFGGADHRRPPPSTSVSGDHGRTSPWSGRPSPTPCRAPSPRAATGLPGAMVHVFDAATYTWVGYTTTTAGGAYTIDLPAGTYKLFVQPDEPGYADQWVGGTGPRHRGVADLSLRQPRPWTSPLVGPPGTYTLSGTVTAARHRAPGRHGPRVRRRHLHLGRLHHHRPPAAPTPSTCPRAPTSCSSSPTSRATPTSGSADRTTPTADVVDLSQRRRHRGRGAGRAARPYTLSGTVTAGGHRAPGRHGPRVRRRHLHLGRLHHHHRRRLLHHRPARGHLQAVRPARRAGLRRPVGGRHRPCRR